MAFRFAIATALAATVVEAGSCNNHGCGMTSCREDISWCNLFNCCGRFGSCADDFAQYVAESDETQPFEKFPGGLELTAAKEAVVADEEKKIEAQEAVEANFEVLTSQEQIDALPEQLKMYLANGIPSGTAVLKLTADVQVVPEEAAPAAEDTEEDPVEAQAAEGDNTEAQTAPEEDSEKAEEKKKVEIDQKATAAARDSFPKDTLIFALNSAKTDVNWQFIPAKADFVKKAADAKSFVAIVPAEPEPKENTAAEPVATPTSSATTDIKPAEPANKSKLGYILGGAGIVLVLIAAFFYFQSGSDEDGEETEDETEEEV